MGQKQCRNSSQSGFTLVELMVVVAIVGILSALSIPVLSRYRDEAKVAAARGVGRQMLNAFAAHVANSPGNMFERFETCDDVAGLVDMNGFHLSPEIWC